MKSIQEVAILSAIDIENWSLDFYRAVSSKVNDINTRQVFEQLAKEDAEHLDYFCNLYQGNENELKTILNKESIYSDPHYSSFLNSIGSDTTVKEALQIALKEARARIELYSIFVKSVGEPLVRDMFSGILIETRKQIEMIEEEYMRFTNMVNETSQETFVRE